MKRLWKMLLVMVMIFGVLLLMQVENAGEIRGRKPEKLPALSYPELMGGFEKMIEHTNAVFEGTVTELGAFQGGPEYTVEVSKTYKGITEDVVHVFMDNVGVDMPIEVGNTYIFFTTKSDSVVWPYPLYNAMFGDMVYRVHGGFHVAGLTRLGDEFVGMRVLKPIFERYFTSLPEFGVHVYDEQKVAESYGLEEMYDKSDYVLVVRVTGQRDLHEHLKEISVIRLVDCKGGSDRMKYWIPGGTDVQAGQRAVLFMSELEDGTVTLTCRNGAVIVENDGKFDEIIDFLKNKVPDGTWDKLTAVETTPFQP